jgi:hypothetical protein
MDTPHPQVDHDDFAAARLLHRLMQQGRDAACVVYGSDREGALRTCEPRDIHRRIVYALSDPSILQWTTALACDALARATRSLNPHARERHRLGLRRPCMHATTTTTSPYTR